MALNRPLLGVNFFAGDVVAGVGPYLAIYLMSAYHWRPAGIGMALAVGSIAAVLVQTPAGAIIDATRWKRSILGTGAAAIGIATCLIVVADDPLWLVYTAQIMIGIAAAFIAPCIAAVTLGLTGSAGFTAQTSANQAWNHAGNVFGAAVGAALALWWAPEGVFLLVATMAICMLVCTVWIDGQAIDHDVARGGIASSDQDGQPSGLMTLISDRRLLVFSVCVVMFHFANAAMLPLVSQKLAIGSDTGKGIAFAAACIVAAQLVMIPMAVLCGAKADVWGRKGLFIFAFAILPFRAVMYTLSDNSYFLIAIQGLDGAANGIFGVVFLLILADVTHGTGRFNVAQGALTALVGLGASLSNLVAGSIGTDRRVLGGFSLSCGHCGCRCGAVYVPHAGNSPAPCVSSNFGRTANERLIESA